MTALPAPDLVPRLGPGTHPSPMCEQLRYAIGDDERVLLYPYRRRVQESLAAGEEPPAFEVAGPRPRLFFAPGTATVGIVTCGGLCPGLNNVIRGLVNTAWFHYGSRRILGFRYGYEGLSAARAAEPMELNPDVVETIHEAGGTVIGTSRGPQVPAEMIATLDAFGVDILFTVGGDGTLRGAQALHEALAARGGRPVAVVGVPKTIDNDIQWVTRSFGFTTAVTHADLVLTAAHAEARAARGGVAVVKLMGRHSGFVAANATLASADVNFCLVPEIDVPMERFLPALEKRLDERRHALVVVAEGFGQQQIAGDLAATGAEPERDASGNLKLADCGTWLRDRIRAWFRDAGKPVDVKYIDPSYTIRSVPATSIDAEYTLTLAQHAVHAAMSGRTGLMIGHWNQRFTHVPIPWATSERRQLNRDDPVWQRVLETTGQEL